MRIFLSCAAILVCLLASGCGKKSLPGGGIAPPIVTVTKPIEREVTDYADFTGRTDAVFSTDIRPRVTGFLVGMPFREGAVVREGDVLFEIDDRQYKAALDHAQGDVERQKGAFVKAQANYDIGLNVQKENPRAISVQEINSRLGARDEAAGSLKVAQANEVSAQLNYDWCKVRSPIDGRVSRYDLTLGNLVNADTTLLTTVVSESPIYVYFDMDENTMLHILRKIVLPSNDDIVARKDGIPVLMGLSDEQGFPHQGSINFANNVVNSSTGTVTVRGTFENPATTSGRRLFRPGMFVRVRLPLGKAHQALLVNEKALGTDQGQKYILVVNSKNVVDYRRVTVGPLQDDGMRVIETGLQPGESVVVSGLQMVRPGVEVKTETGPMEEPAPKDQEPRKS